MKMLKKRINGSITHFFFQFNVYFLEISNIVYGKFCELKKFMSAIFITNKFQAWFMVILYMFQISKRNLKIHDLSHGMNQYTRFDQ